MVGIFVQHLMQQAVSQAFLLLFSILLGQLVQLLSLLAPVFGQLRMPLHNQ
jgi:hypothetical protein